MNQRQAIEEAKKPSVAASCDSEVGSGSSVWGSTDSGSADDDIKSDSNVVCTGSVTSPTLMKADSPTPSQTQVCGALAYFFLSWERARLLV